MTPFNTLDNTKQNRLLNKNIKHSALLIIFLIAINYLSSILFKRFDLTVDKRYTLSEASINTIKELDAPIIIDVFLSGDDFPSEFRRLQTETKQLLEEFAAKNGNINFHFIKRDNA